MNEAAAAVAPGSPGHSHLKRFLIGGVLIVVIGAAANLLGWDLRDWFADLWDTINEISAAYLVGAIALKTLQTTATAFAWYAILHYAYPSARYTVVLACYATSVALNGFLPANIGTLVMLLMFTTIIAKATFSGVLGGYVVQKIFFTLSGAFTYLYLFLSVGGSFDVKFAFVHERPWATAVLLLGIVMLVYLLVHALWPKVVKWWDQAKEGGGIITEPRKYLIRVFTPELVAWLASLGVMADARRRGCEPGVQRRLAERGHRPDDRDRLLGRAAARDDRLEHHLRNRHAHLGFRLDRRQEARPELLRRREGEDSGAEGLARREERGKAGGEACLSPRRSSRVDWIPTPRATPWWSRASAPLPLRSLKPRPSRPLPHCR